MASDKSEDRDEIRFRSRSKGDKGRPLVWKQKEGDRCLSRVSYASY